MSNIADAIFTVFSRNLYAAASPRLRAPGMALRGSGMFFARELVDVKARTVSRFFPTAVFRSDIACIDS
jgi:hypothetical protein